MRFGDAEWRALRAPDISWPPRDPDERERMIDFVIEELGFEDQLAPRQSTGTGLLLRLIDAWRRKDELKAKRDNELEEAAKLGWTAAAWDAAKAVSQPKRGRGRPRREPLERMPDLLVEAITIDAQRIPQVFLAYWGHCNYTHNLIPTVAEILIRRYRDDAAEQGIDLSEAAIKNMTKRGRGKRKLLID